MKLPPPWVDNSSLLQELMLKIVAKTNTVAKYDGFIIVNFGLNDQVQC